ncbi:MAG: AMP-binding protein, partial [Mailhella sp.]|nr:AMP-binding protein [Mailhella sp.]
MMLPPSFITDLLQSFLLSQRHSRGGFPPVPRDAASFEKDRWPDVCTRQEYCAAAASVRSMLFAGRDDGSLPGDAAYGLSIRETARKLYEEWTDSPRTVTFSTSGSTGVPKRCTHTLSDLMQEAEYLAPFFKDIRACISTVPAHHLFGFTFGLFLPHFAGFPITRVPPLPAAALANAAPGSAVIGIPFFWNAVCRTMRASPEGVLAVTGTAPAGRELLDAIAASFSLIDIFGSSETGVLGLRTHPGDPYTLTAYFEKATDGSLLRHRKNADGQVSGASHPSAHHPEKAASLLYTECEKTHVIAEDDLFWTDDRHFLPLGRKDKCVQVAGVNVHPALVAEKIRAMEEVRDCAVR